MTTPAAFANRWTRLALCCNDGRGNPRRRADSLRVRGVHVELHPPLMVRETGGVLQVGRVRVPHRGVVHWWGNIFWNCWYVTPADAVQVLEYAQRRGATCAEAPVEFVALWDSGEALVLPGPEWEGKA